ncbi:cupin domain-containing protein [Marimonas arenosa]|uniref:Cupin domain-containing protein n=1 Tax=Marimonas arenosa TaxID=1795305 RepID=A0AAE4B717_9RHOB|nr:cupin domain-containing protein [Marimonas arenosa]MDQ2090981.1 cupin domain-containing protein [Marimonas arenosa]
MNILGPDALEWMGSVYRILLEAGETGGAVAIFESVTGPGEGPPLHIHGDADETFVVLSGDVEFWVEGARTIRGPGQVAFVPRGREHGFRVCGEAPARMLTMLTPGGFERFFCEMVAGGYRLPEDMGRVRAVAEQYQLEFTGPPLDAPGAQNKGG